MIRGVSSFVTGAAAGNDMRLDRLDRQAEAAARRQQPGGPAPAPAGGVAPGGVQGMVFERLRSNGIPDHIAAGFIGNFQQESGFNPRAHNAEEDAHGFAQWRQDRLINLDRFAASRGRDRYDPETQADFVLHEINGPEKAAWARIQSAKTPEEAAALIDRHYERSAGKHTAARQRYASEFYAGIRPAQPQQTAAAQPAPEAEPMPRTVAQTMAGSAKESWAHMRSLFKPA